MIRKNELGCFTSLLIIISSLFFSASIAQSFLPNFRHYSVADGLPSTEVYQITSDAKNNLWFATDRGVVRYDGYAFRVFNTKDSLPDNSVIKVYKDSKQRIWFISFTSHLSYYENGRIVLYKYNKQLTEHIGRGLIASLYVDKNDNIKVNSVDIGTFSIDNKGRLQQLDLISDTCEFVISETEPGIANTKIHCNNNYSATRFNVSIPTSRFSFTIPVGIRSQHFNTIILKNGDFIFYADRYMIRIHRNGTYEIKILANKILNVFEDHDENIWVGCLHDGVYIYDSYMHSSSHFLSESSISHIYADYEGGFWLSSLENGIFYLPSKNINSLNVSGNVMHDKITSIVNKADSLLFFSNSKGVLFRYSLPDHDLKSINLKQNREIDMESINALTFKNSTNDLIVSTAAGLKFDSISLHKMNWEGLNLTTLPSFIKFFQSDNDNLLGSDYSYAYSLNLSKSSINYINKTQFRSTVLFQDSQKRLFSRKHLIGYNTN